MTIPNNSVIASNNHSLLNATKFKDAVLDALSEIYWSLNDFDMFYGLWKRRAMYPETNAALTYEQMGLWKEAQEMYEKAQIRARNGLLPFSESEYCLWEDRWVDCTEKLQQWDLCNDLAKHENNIELQLECSWRVTDWNSERESLESSVLMYENNIVSPTNGNSVRLKSFQAFLTLSQLQESADKMPDLQKIIDEGIQACLVKWHSLPRIVGKSHVNVLHSFQQFVELQEASHIYLGVNTNTNNPNSRVQVMQELKGTLGTWRERLPNLWDDINLWSELVAWRQHVFSVINRSYQPLTEQQQPNQPGNNTLMSMAYRGYHEIAWIINRFLFLRGD
jgi:transformation/transcription domain-associated protein